MTSTTAAVSLPFGLQPAQLQALEAIADRALAQMAHMIWEANHRPDHAPTDPKVGGHPAACASSLHLATALHLVARAPQDFWCGKPHMAPLDHVLHYFTGFFRDAGGAWMDEGEMEGVMHRLRKFSQAGEPVFQSYHAASDPDSWRILPSGTVGIPPVNSGYMALAWDYLVDHGLEEKRDIHFWSLMGDSEFREGTLMEAATDFAERGLSQVTWIVDYNRQSLDGTRLIAPDVFDGSDATRIRRTMEANGWEVLELQHGRKRMAAFEGPGGAALCGALEHGISDFELQALLWKKDADLVRAALTRIDKKAAPALQALSDDKVLELLADMGGHDLVLILEAFEQARQSDRPTFILAHTVKGLGLDCVAESGNHSALPDETEIGRLLEAQGLSMESPYGRQGNWEADGEELRLLAARREVVQNGVAVEEARMAATRQRIEDRLESAGPLPQDFGIDLSMMPIVHTQWMWGQVAGKVVRIGTQDEYAAAGQETGRELNDAEQKWAAAADLMLTMSPDVGTSTNINPAMDGKIYGTGEAKDWEAEVEWSERGRPQLHASHDPWTRHIRFEIAEAASMSAAGSFGKTGDYFGAPLLPMMTVYDFFIKRALDQLYYNVYWRSSFLLIGTPSGITLAPEGAQHSWKSDIQMPSMVTWEPFYAKEMEWILADAMDRHCRGDHEDREGVVVRAVTMGVRQKELMKRLKAQARHQAADGSPLPEDSILTSLREDVLAGGYWLVHHAGDADYQPGENVVTILAMGALGSEALKAADALRERGICADVLMCTSPELLLGRFAERDGFAQLKKLGVDGAVHLVGTAGEVLDAADAMLLAARTIPIVSVVDGEPGLLDNAGAIVGVKQVSLGVKKFSKSGRPEEIFAYHGLDADSIADAAGQALAESTLREVKLSPQAARELESQGRITPPNSDWREFWPKG
ncbi:MAG: pyruvate dehydrogenase [Planctomycetota bacterium]